jgi:Rrf2 family transcriptional regulator, iron-sulfur cluster assembly transcription factor
MGLQLTRGSEYAIRAMMYLAGRPAGEVSSLRDVGREQNIPESFLAKIFQNLVHSGLVISQRGARGGFALARPGSQITVAQVVQAIDGPVSLNGCVLWPDTCERSASCAMHRVWISAQERMMGVLGDVTFADLAPVLIDHDVVRSAAGPQPSAV